MNQAENWQLCNSQLFWREIAPNAHVLQIYDADDALLTMLESYVAGGLSADESVIIIGTAAHLAALEARLTLLGLSLPALSAADQYIAINAETLLATFMVNDWPDYNLFLKAIDQVFDRVQKHRRPVRAFGEMVGLLLARGNSAATVMLEHFWNSYCEDHSFALFCAYHEKLFAGNSATSLLHICEAHTMQIKAGNPAGTELAYQNAVWNAA